MHKNLGEALEVLLARHLTAHRKQKTITAEPEEPAQSDQRSSRLTARKARVVQIQRAQRLARYEQVILLSKQGLSQEAMAQRMGIGHSTLGQWLAAGTFPERKRRQQSSQLDPYLPYALKRWSEGGHNIARIYEERKRARVEGILRNSAYSSSSPATACSGEAASLSLGVASAGFLTAGDLAVASSARFADGRRARNGHDSATAPSRKSSWPMASSGNLLVTLRTRTGEKLDRWLEAVEKSPLTELQSFVTGVYQDKAAVQAGLTLPWSNDYVA